MSVATWICPVRDTDMFQCLECLINLILRVLVAGPDEVAV